MEQEDTCFGDMITSGPKPPQGPRANLEASAYAPADWGKSPAPPPSFVGHVGHLPSGHGTADVQTLADVKVDSNYARLQIELTKEVIYSLGHMQEVLVAIFNKIDLATQPKKRGRPAGTTGIKRRVKAKAKGRK